MIKLSDGQEIQDSSIKIMASVIQNMLDYGQIKSGNFRKNFRTSNIRDTVEKVISIQKRQAEERKILLHAEYINIAENEQEDGQCSPMLNCDHERVIQLLLNLQSNALKFTERGSVKINVSIEEQEEERKQLKIDVIDTGIGIKLEDQDKLFKLFGYV